MERFLNIILWKIIISYIVVLENIFLFIIQWKNIFRYTGTEMYKKVQLSLKNTYPNKIRNKQ